MSISIRRMALVVVICAAAVIIMAAAGPRITKAIADTSAAKNELAVDLDKLQVDQVLEGISDEFLASSMAAYDSERTERSGFSDALTLPFTKTDKAGVIDELREESRNPVWLQATILALKDQKVGLTTIGQQNKWMDEFLSTMNEHGAGAWVYSDSGVLRLTQEYRKYEAGVITLLAHLVWQGKDSLQSERNWCLNMAAFNSERRAVEAEYQEDKEAYVFHFVLKNGDVLFKLGFNVHDKRPELLKDKVDKPTSSGTTGGGGGDNPVTPTPTPTPDPKPDPDPDPDPKPDGCSDAQTWVPSYGQEAEHNYDDDTHGGNVEWRVKEERSGTKDGKDLGNGSVLYDGVDDPKWFETPTVQDQPTTSGGQATGGGKANQVVSGDD